MKVVIAGSRGITKMAALEAAISMSNFHISEVVSGGARGVDRLGEEWAKQNDVPIKQFIPDWDGPLGKGAGFARNTDMAKYADALIALWDGKSRGTKQMIEQARKLGLLVFVMHL